MDLGSLAAQVGNPIGAAAQIYAGIRGNKEQSRAIKNQQQMMEELNRQLAQIGIPPVNPLQFKQIDDTMASLNPDEMFKVAQQGPSALAEMKVDRAGRNAQLQALTRLQQEGAQGGMTVEDQLAYEQATTDANSADAARQAALQESFQRRGVAGGGQEALSRMLSQQNAANQGRFAGLQTAANARQRALQAIMSAGQLGSGLQTADTNEAMARAQAADEVNRFNTSLLQGGYNARGNARMDIARNTQNVAAQNTGIANTQMEYNANEPWKQFGAQMQKFGAQAGVTGAKAGLEGQVGQNAANFYKGMADATASAFRNTGPQTNGPQNSPAQGASLTAPVSTPSDQTALWDENTKKYYSGIT